MESAADSGVIKVLDAYTRVLVGISRGVIYLFFVTASTISGALTGLAFLLLGTGWAAGLIGLASFSITFGFSVYISVFLGRLQGSYQLQQIPAEQRARAVEDWRSTGKRIGLAWFAAIVLGWGLAALLSSSVEAIPIGVSLGVALGLVLMYMLMRARGAGALQDLLVGVYLLASLPIYFYLPSNASISPFGLGFLILTINLSAAYFCAAISYALGARKKAAEVLYAARG